MYLENKKLFLAGSTGLAGTSILRNIIKYYPSVKIRAVYFKNTKPFIEHPQIEYVQGDLRSSEDCNMLARGCDCAIMTAAYTGGSRFVTSFPLEHIKNNLIMNMQMLEAFHGEGVKRIVYVGSATLYHAYEGKVRENDLDLSRDPDGAYVGFGWSGRFIERLCCFMHKTLGHEVLITRTSNIYGPFAKFDPQMSNFIPAIIRKAVDKMDPFEVWGNCDVARDVIYADDFAGAIIGLMNSDDIRYGVFNLGGGKSVTVGEVVNLALKCAGHDPSKIRYLSDKPVTMKPRVLDCTNIQSVLNWRSMHSIEEGIKKTMDWWINNKEWWTK